MMDYVLNLVKENVYCEAIKESVNSNSWTLRLNFKKLLRDIVEPDLETDS